MKQATCNPTQTPVPQADGWMCTDALSTVRHRVCRAAARAMQQGATSRHPHALMRPAPVVHGHVRARPHMHLLLHAPAGPKSCSRPVYMDGYGQARVCRELPLKPVQCSYFSRCVPTRALAPCLLAACLRILAADPPAPPRSPMLAFLLRCPYIIVLCQLRSEQAKAP